MASGRFWAENFAACDGQCWASIVVIFKEKTTAASVKCVVRAIARGLSDIQKLLFQVGFV